MSQLFQLMVSLDSIPRQGVPEVSNMSLSLF